MSVGDAVQIEVSTSQGEQSLSSYYGIDGRLKTARWQDRRLQPLQARQQPEWRTCGASELVQEHDPRCIWPSRALTSLVVDWYLPDPSRSEIPLSQRPPEDPRRRLALARPSTQRKLAKPFSFLYHQNHYSSAADCTLRIMASNITWQCVRHLASPSVSRKVR